MGPFVILEEGINNFFHREIRNQLVLCEFDAGDRIEMANTLQMLFDIFSLVCDSWRRDYGLGQDFKTNFATQIIRYIALLQITKQKWKSKV